jgi:hypothetical protein
MSYTIKLTYKEIKTNILFSLKFSFLPKTIKKSKPKINNIIFKIKPFFLMYSMCSPRGSLININKTKAK